MMTFKSLLILVFLKTLLLAIIFLFHPPFLSSFYNRKLLTLHYKQAKRFPFNSSRNSFQVGQRSKFFLVANAFLNAMKFK